MTPEQKEDRDYHVQEMARAVAAETAKTLATEVARTLAANAGTGHPSPCEYARSTRWWAVTILAAIAGTALTLVIWTVQTYRAQDSRIAATELSQAVSSDRYATLISMVSTLSLKQDRLSESLGKP